MIYTYSNDVKKDEEKAKECKKAEGGKEAGGDSGSAADGSGGSGTTSSVSETTQSTSGSAAQSPKTQTAATSPTVTVTHTSVTCEGISTANKSNGSSTGTYHVDCRGLPAVAQSTTGGNGFSHISYGTLSTCAKAGVNHSFKGIFSFSKDNEAGSTAATGVVISTAESLTESATHAIAALKCAHGAAASTPNGGKTSTICGGQPSPTAKPVLSLTHEVTAMACASAAANAGSSDIGAVACAGISVKKTALSEDKSISSASCARAGIATTSDSGGPTAIDVTSCVGLSMESGKVDIVTDSSATVLSTSNSGSKNPQA